MKGANESIATTERFGRRKGRPANLPSGHVRDLFSSPGLRPGLLFLGYFFRGLPSSFAISSSSDSSGSNSPSKVSSGFAGSEEAGGAGGGSFASGGAKTGGLGATKAGAA